MDRRTFLGGVGLAVALRALAAEAQEQRKVWRVGFLYFGSRRSSLDTRRYPAFLDGVRELGYVEGKTFLVESRFAEGNVERLTSMAAELVRLNVDVILTTGAPATRAVQQATTAIPVVMTVGADPIATGFAASLARPGGNITGLSSSNAELIQKDFELLATALPRLSRVGVLMNPANPSHGGQRKLIEAAATKTRLAVVTVNARTAEDIERGFVTLTRNRSEAVIVLADAFLIQQARQMAELALKHRLPSMYGIREHVDAGGFMSYGPDIKDQFRRSASYVDKIFKGARPGDLPIEQPTKFELLINLKTAKALGLTIPQSLLYRADQVIQ